jgi:prophage antirepressor-like protein
MRALQIFENAEFGKIRTVVLDDEPWFVGKDVAAALGYTNSRKALADHVDEEDKNTVTIRDGIQGNPNMTIINESGVYSLVFSSKLPTAKAFKRWVTSEVLPSIRKTGGYPMPNAAQAKRADAMDRDSRTRAAKLLLKIAERVEIPEYKAVCQAKAAEMVAGEMVIPLPVVDRRTYSAKEIGARLGISANRVGKLANLYRLKTPTYGKLFYSKSEYSPKQVETWRYYAEVVPALRNILEQN